MVNKIVTVNVCDPKGKLLTWRLLLRTVGIIQLAIMFVKPGLRQPQVRPGF